MCGEIGSACTSGDALLSEQRTSVAARRRNVPSVSGMMTAREFRLSEGVFTELHICIMQQCQSVRHLPDSFEGELATDE